jgi:hypothetical protein
MGVKALGIAMGSMRGDGARASARGCGFSAILLALNAYPFGMGVRVLT